MTTRTIALSSPAHYGRRVPTQPFGHVLQLFPNAIQRSVRMAVEGRSRARGKPPRWLRAAADIRFLGHEGEDQTLLHFDAPTLGEAAPRLYEQQEFWPTRPDADETGFDILADVFRDVSAGEADSERFDRPLLDSLARFGKVVDGTFNEIRLPGRQDSPDGPVLVTPQVVESARSLYTNTPQPRRVRVVGRLDMVRASTQSFGVLLDDGQEIRGVLAEGDIEDVGVLLNQRVLVVGVAVYRASGRLLRIDAEAVTTTTEEGRFFSTVPKPVRRQFDLRDTVREQQHKAGIAAVIGKWPGDESEEEVRQALKDLS